MASQQLSSGANYCPTTSRNARCPISLRATETQHTPDKIGDNSLGRSDSSELGDFPQLARNSCPGLGFCFTERKTARRPPTRARPKQRGRRGLVVATVRRTFSSLSGAVCCATDILMSFVENLLAARDLASDVSTSKIIHFRRTDVFQPRRPRGGRLRSRQ